MYGAYLREPEGSSAGYAIQRFQSKRIHRWTMASKLTCANQAAIAYE
jgi:hypothetical protein